MRHLARFFTTWRFPVFVIAAVLLWQVLLLALLLLPAGDPAAGGFLTQFRVWCFGLDPATGALDGAIVAMTFTEPLFLAAIVAAVWWRPLREIVRSPRRALPVVLTAAVLVAAGGAAFALLDEPEVVDASLFPGERIRTAIPATDFELVDHEGQPIRLSALRGKVVVVTGVYASCGATCPMLMAQARRVVEALPASAREGLTFVAITMDPEHDDVATLGEMARLQEVTAPTFRLVTGPPAAVNKALDAYGVSRTRDPATGRIDHVNLYSVIDRDGRVAYRFGLGDLQEQWLVQALVSLLGEARPTV
jgi:protein SCO1/2